MKLFQLYKKHSDVVNLILILCIVVYLSVHKPTIENFNANTIDFSALSNLAEVAKGLNSDGTYTMPGNLVINGTLTTKGTLTTNGKLTVKDDLIAQKALQNKSVVGCYLLSGYNEAVLKTGGGSGYGQGFMPLLYGDWIQIVPSNNTDAIYVLEGFKVKVFDSQNFGGKSKEYGPGIYKLSDGGMANNIDSVKVKYSNESF